MTSQLTIKKPAPILAEVKQEIKPNYVSIFECKDWQREGD